MLLVYVHFSSHAMQLTMPINAVSAGSMNSSKIDYQQIDGRSVNGANERFLLECQMFSAARVGDAAKMLSLLAQGVEINARDARGRFVLHFLARFGLTEAVKEFIEQGASVNAKYNFDWWTSNGVTALHEAATRGHEKIVSLLIQEGADINAQDHKGRTALQGYYRWSLSLCQNVIGSECFDKRC